MMMEWWANNWYYVVFCVLAVCVIWYGIATQKVKEWLKWAVCYAEQELGGSTGQLKLRMVYDMFLEQFPTIGSIMPFSTFSKFVDLALDWMREQLEKNEAIRLIIEG